MTVLALEYRPKRFSEVVGQRHVLAILRTMVQDQDVPPALLFGGSRGTGKTTTARILAAALNCEDSKDGDACAECASCKAVAAGNSLAVLEVDAASNGLVDDVRKIKDMVSYDVAGLWRVVMLDEAHSMSRPAFNALLKVLEEPPPRTTFVLLTTEVPRIPDTVVSRSMAFTFRRMTLADIEGRLKEIAADKGLQVTAEMLLEIAEYAQGGMRDAVMTLDQCSRVKVGDVEGFRELFGIQDIAVSILQAAMEGKYGDGARLIDDYFYRVGDAQGMVRDLVTLVADLFSVKSDFPPIRVANPEALAIRKEMAAKVSTGRLSQVATVLWELKSRTRAVDNDQRASMELAFVLITAVLSPETIAEPIQPAMEERRLSLAEVVDLAKGYQR
jgi:DNA polymerase-3 subunit gamma/tau